MTTPTQTPAKRHRPFTLTRLLAKRELVARPEDTPHNSSRGFAEYFQEASNKDSSL
jgi:hypothetical protein